MFNKNFYPTPIHVLDLMNIDCMNKTVLEPQAGKGDIVDYLKLNGAKKVIACEINKDLQKIVQSKCQLVGDDFFTITKGDVSHVQMIVMNPPFDNADKHIMHAFEIAPEGCEIISLCNWQTISNKSRYRLLTKLINDSYGVTENLGNCFSNSERKTDVPVGLVRLFKPIVSQSTEFDGFFIDEEPKFEGSNGLMPFNEVRNVVNRYVEAVKEFDNVIKSLEIIKQLTNEIVGASSLSVKVSDELIENKHEYMKNLQVKSWEYVINKAGVRKYTTSEMNAEINKFVNTQNKYPFTMKNVYQMFNIIIQTRKQQFDKSLVNVIDNFTRHTKENRFEVEGWVANEGHLLSKKIIIPNIFKRVYDYENGCDSKYVTPEWYGFRGVNSNFQRLDDLVKIICLLSGYMYDDILKLRDYSDKKGNITTNKWLDMGIFTFKAFYKGTIHLKFKDEKDWYLVNQAYGKLKGFVLPEKYKKK